MLIGLWVSFCCYFCLRRLLIGRWWHWFSVVALVVCLPGSVRADSAETLSSPSAQLFLEAYTGTLGLAYCTASSLLDAMAYSGGSSGTLTISSGDWMLWEPQSSGDMLLQVSAYGAEYVGGGGLEPWVTYTGDDGYVYHQGSFTLARAPSTIVLTGSTSAGWGGQVGAVGAPVTFGYGTMWVRDDGTGGLWVSVTYSDSTPDVLFEVFPAGPSAPGGVYVWLADAVHGYYGTASSWSYPESHLGAVSFVGLGTAPYAISFSGQNITPVVYGNNFFSFGKPATAPAVAGHLPSAGDQVALTTISGPISLASVVSGLGPYAYSVDTDTFQYILLSELGWDVSSLGSSADSDARSAWAELVNTLYTPFSAAEDSSDYGPVMSMDHASIISIGDLAIHEVEAAAGYVVAGYPGPAFGSAFSAIQTFLLVYLLWRILDDNVIEIARIFGKQFFATFKKVWRTK